MVGPREGSRTRCNRCDKAKAVGPGKPEDLPQLRCVEKNIGSPLGHRLRCRYLRLAKGRWTPFPFEGKGLGKGLDPSLKLKRGRGDFRKSRRTEGDPRRRLNLKPKTAEGHLTLESFMFYVLRYEAEVPVTFNPKPKTQNGRRP